MDSTVNGVGQALPPTAVQEFAICGCTGSLQQQEGHDGIAPILITLSEYNAEAGVSFDTPPPAAAQRVRLLYWPLLAFRHINKL
jgi:hypothetical protein